MNRVLAMSYAPWRYVRGNSIEILRGELEQRFGGHCALFGSGREALLAYLKAINLKVGEEVIVQGYTCVVVPNAIHAAGGVPVYADINEETLNLSVETVRPLITSRTRAIICQHTFGIPAETHALRKLCDEKNILLVEDCAHVLPDDNDLTDIGKHGDAMLLSFGRDKAVSGITGGAIITKNPTTSATIRIMESSAIEHSAWHMANILEYASRMRGIVRPLIGLGLHKPIVAVLNRLGIFVPILTTEECKGHMSPILHRLPNACAYLARFSLSRLREINDHRRQLTAFYLAHGRTHDWPQLTGIRDNLPLQKFPLFVAGADAARAKLRTKNIHLNDGWTGCVVCPDTVSPSSAGYADGSDPVAEVSCKKILSLPVHPTMTMQQAERLVREIDDVLLL